MPRLGPHHHHWAGVVRTLQSLGEGLGDTAVNETLARCPGGPIPLATGSVGSQGLLPGLPWADETSQRPACLALADTVLRSSSLVGHLIYSLTITSRKQFSAP